MDYYKLHPSAKPSKSLATVLIWKFLDAFLRLTFIIRLQIKSSRESIDGLFFSFCLAKGSTQITLVRRHFLLSES